MNNTNDNTNTEKDTEKDRTEAGCIFFCYKNKMDSGSCGRSKRKGRKGRTAFWND